MANDETLRSKFFRGYLGGKSLQRKHIPWNPSPKWDTNSGLSQIRRNLIRNLYQTIQCIVQPQIHDPRSQPNQKLLKFGLLSERGLKLIESNFSRTKRYFCFTYNNSCKNIFNNRQTLPLILSQTALVKNLNPVSNQNPTGAAQTLRWCCTGRFATTIFSVTQCCNVGTML